MVPDHGFTRVGTMQVQAIMPPLILIGCVIAQAFFSRGVSAISLKSIGFFQRGLAQFSAI